MDLLALFLFICFLLHVQECIWPEVGCVDRICEKFVSQSFLDNIQMVEKEVISQIKMFTVSTVHRYKTKLTDIRTSYSLFLVNH